MEAMHAVDNTGEYVRCKSSTQAGKGCCCEATSISPPALGLELFMRVIFETVDQTLG